MKPALKAVIVAAGYVAAFLIASAAVTVRVANTSGPVAQASSGMYAAGDAFLFLGVFGVCALVPTGAALIFLRSYRGFWVVLSVMGVAVAVTGVSAAILFAVGRTAEHSPLATLASLSVLRILVAPLLALTFLVSALFSPYSHPRRALFGATVMEVAVSVYGGFVWFLPMLLHKP